MTAESDGMMAESDPSFLIAHGEQRYRRSPRCRLVDQRVRLSWLEWYQGREERKGAYLSSDSFPLEPAQLDFFEPAQLGTKVVEDRDVAHASAGWGVEVCYRGGRSTVRVQTPAHQIITIWDAFGTAAAPYIHPTSAGAWVAFHHNVREDDGSVDLPKWIALRYVDQKGVVWSPLSEPQDRDRDLSGEEQGFEFPTLTEGDDGAVALFGRGSHCFWRQDLNRGGWVARSPISTSEWGCRGRRVAVAPCGEYLIAVYRERRGLRVLRTAPASGGPPRLRKAEVKVAQPTYAAAPQVVRPSLPSQRILFGDIHQHTAHSDGCGSADEPYLRARHVYGDDFCAVSDHESFLGKRIYPAEWKYLQEVADAHNAPDSFATLLAYEWTGRMHPGPGHKVVYLSSRDTPICSRDELSEGQDLLRALRSQGAFAVPHHVGWTGADEAAHAEDVQPVWEICSCHGCYEYAVHELGQRGDLRDQMIDHVLQRGLRFGLIAGSDGHGLLWHHGIARRRDSHRTGLTAVLSESCTREAVMEAIRSRRCYATSGAKIHLWVRVNGLPMGSELPKEQGTHFEVEVEARGESKLKALRLVGPAGVLREVMCDKHEAKLHCAVDTAYLYVRVEQDDGELAWSSPVFAQSTATVGLPG